MEDPQATRIVIGAFVEFRDDGKIGQVRLPAGGDSDYFCSAAGAHAQAVSLRRQFRITDAEEGLVDFEAAKHLVLVDNQAHPEVLRRCEELNRKRREADEVTHGPQPIVAPGATPA